MRWESQSLQKSWTIWARKLFPRYEVSAMGAPYRYTQSKGRLLLLHLSTREVGILPVHFVAVVGHHNQVYVSVVGTGQWANKVHRHTIQRLRDNRLGKRIWRLGLMCGFGSLALNALSNELSTAIVLASEPETLTQLFIHLRNTEMTTIEGICMIVKYDIICQLASR